MRLLSIIVFVFKCTLASSQVHESNFILVVNDRIVVGDIANPELASKKSGRKFAITYFPGNLILSSSDYERLATEDTDTLYFQFDHFDNDEKKQIVTKFKLEFAKKWLSQDYTIMRVYNLSKPRYKGLFKPLDGSRNYTYELDYPGGQMLRIMSKKRGPK